VCSFTQLKERDYWVKVFHPELGESLTYVGPYARMPNMPIKYYRRPPTVGEHNEEVYLGELGIPKERLSC